MLNRCTQARGLHPATSGCPTSRRACGADKHTPMRLWQVGPRLLLLQLVRPGLQAAGRGGVGQVRAKRPAVTGFDDD